MCRKGNTVAEQRGWGRVELEKEMTRKLDINQGKKDGMKGASFFMLDDDDDASFNISKHLL